jgi:hypothetical protein
MGVTKGVYSSMQMHGWTEHDVLRAWPKAERLVEKDRTAQQTYRWFVSQMAQYNSWVEGLEAVEAFGNYGDVNIYLVSHVDQEVRLLPGGQAKSILIGTGHHP